MLTPDPHAGIAHIDPVGYLIVPVAPALVVLGTYEPPRSASIQVQCRVEATEGICVEYLAP